MKTTYSIISRGTIIINYGPKVIKASGELTFDPPVFYLDSSSLKNWEPPHEQEIITETEKQEIIKSLSEIEPGQTRIIFD